MSKRYIDADALLEALPDDLPYKASVKRVLIQAPAADVVEVVRCRECKHYQNDIFFGRGWCNGRNVEKDDYCSYGERKEI